VFILGLDGSAPVPLVRGGGAAWSPDGDTIVYVSRCDVRATTPEGLHDRNLVDLRSVQPQTGRCRDGVLVWSPDGRKLAALANGLFEMNADGSNARLVSDHTASGLTWQPVPLAPPMEGVMAAAPINGQAAPSTRYGMMRKWRNPKGMTTIEIDGRPPDATELWDRVSSYGHFTAMQVRGRKARGVALHLERLEAANLEAFGVGLDAERVRVLVRHALGDTQDASLRVYIFETPTEPTTLVTVKPPGEMATPQRLRSARYQRPAAHIKHVTTDQGLYRKQAQRDGGDDALLIGEHGIVSETTFANIGFFDESGVVWPDAPLLHGITMRLLERTLPEAGVPTRRATVSLADIPSFRGAFLTNARGIAAVSSVDDMILPDGRERLKTLHDAYASVSWDTI
jgi:branched-subunit amino acid aminotransferase/4-amino-4-deoxychorismate lyase